MCVGPETLKNISVEGACTSKHGRVMWQDCHKSKRLGFGFSLVDKSRANDRVIRDVEVKKIF